MDNETLQAIRQMFIEEREHTSWMIDEKLKAEREHTSRMIDEKLKAEREHTGRMIDEKLDKKLDEKLQPIKADLEELKEGIQEIRTSVSTIIDWIDEAEHAIDIRFPVKKEQA